MGRHSAPDDADNDSRDETASVAVLTDGAASARGRHSRGAGPAEAVTEILPALHPDDETTQIEPIVDPVVDQPMPQADTQQLPKVEDAAPPPDLIPGMTPEPVAVEPRTPAASAAAPVASDPAPTPDADADAERQPSGARGSAADLALLRRSGAARALVAAAVLVPFVIYTVVLLVLDKVSARTYLIWIWIPLITAGVLVGLVLDAAHRRALAPAPASRP